jgi:hypothetical protein
MTAGSKLDKYLGNLNSNKCDTAKLIWLSRVMAIAYSAVNSPGLYMRYKRIKKLHLHIIHYALDAHRAIKDIIKINIKSVIWSCLIANRRKLNY